MPKSRDYTSNIWTPKIGGVASPLPECAACREFKRPKLRWPRRATFRALRFAFTLRCVLRFAFCVLRFAFCASSERCVSRRGQARAIRSRRSAPEYASGSARFSKVSIGMLHLTILPHSVLYVIA